MKTTQLLLLIGTFALGSATGGYLMHRSQVLQATISDTTLLTSTLAANSGMGIAFLIRLRDGRTDEVRTILESNIDANLVMLSDRIAQLPVAERNPEMLKVIQAHLNYRKQFPYTNSVPYLREGITKAYTLMGSRPISQP
jgi:hypothetical protein